MEIIELSQTIHNTVYISKIKTYKYHSLRVISINLISEHYIALNITHHFSNETYFV